MRKFKAFTIIELLVSIGIIAILISIILPFITQLKRTANATKCQRNHSQLVAAWVSFSFSNKYVMPRSDTESGAWVDAGNSKKSIEDGVLFSYINDLEVYRCPSDESGHYRSYSANGFLNGNSSWPFHPWIKPFKYLNSVVHHDGQLLFVEENDPRGYNTGSWVIHPKGHPNEDQWIDYVGIFHKNGDNVSFLDGHVEFIKYKDSRTFNFTDGGSHFYESHPDSADLKLYQSIYNTN